MILDNDLIKDLWNQLRVLPKLTYKHLSSVGGTISCHEISAGSNPAKYLMLILTYTLIDLYNAEWLSGRAVDFGSI